MRIAHLETKRTMKVEAILPCIYFDIEISGRPVGRIVIELFQDAAPKACANLLELCPRFRGTYFHRVIKNFMIQGGDILYAQSNDYNDSEVGSGGHPDGVTFADENTAVDLNEAFYVCMANLGKDLNGLQFFITTAKAPHLQGKHTVFGKVTHGKSVVREVERVATTPENVPLREELPVIANCGEWTEGDPTPVFNACYDPIAGDIYEEYPDDDAHINKESSKSVFEAASVIKDSGSALLKKQDYANAIFKYKKAYRYVMEFVPDEDQEPEYYAKFVDLKKKLYLNLSLAYHKQKDDMKCIEYCNFLLDMDLSPAERAKTLFRLGGAMVNLRKYPEALTIYTQARELLNDALIAKELQRAEDLVSREKERERAKYAKFFG